MFTNPHNQNLLNDVMRVLNGETTEQPIRPIPTWLSEAAVEAVNSLNEAYNSGEVMTLEIQRDILRKHLSEAVSNCNCEVSKDTPIQFEEAIAEAKRAGNRPMTGKSGIQDKIKTLTASTNGKGYHTYQVKKVRITEIRISRYVRSENVRDKPLLQMEVYFNTKDWNTKKDDLIYGDEKWISELRKGLQSIGFVATGLDYTEQGMQEDDFVSVETSNKAAVESFLSKLVNKNQIKDIPTGFAEAADEELDEANQRLRKPKPHEEVYYKWFGGVEVSVMDMSKISKEIQAALDSKADLDKVMPELVKKYGKNSLAKKEEFEEMVMESDPTELELREFLTQLTSEEVTILRNIINENR